MRPVLGLLGFCVAIVLASGCSRPSIKVDGSSTVIRITEAVTEEFHKEQPNVRVTGGRSGTGGGFKKFSNGEIDICDASRRINEVERKACEANGVNWVELQIAFDGISFVANPQNDWCDCLTVEQLKKMWEPGSKVAKWSDIDSKWPQQPLKLYGPGTDSGTFDYFTEAIIGKTGQCRQDFSASEDDNILVMGVEGDKYSLGYFGLAYYEENQAKLKLLGVDPGDGVCVKPSVETVRDGTYKPLSRPLFIYVSTAALARPEVRNYVKYYLDNINRVSPPQNESLVKSAGYVPLPEEILDRSKEALEEALTAIPVD
jgi:phosphate transport system substrate-binding protein